MNMWHTVGSTMNIVHTAWMLPFAEKKHNKMLTSHNNSNNMKSIEKSYEKIKRTPNSSDRSNNKNAYVRCNSLRIPDDYSIYRSISRIFASLRKTHIKTRSSCISIAYRPHKTCAHRPNKYQIESGRKKLKECPWFVWCVYGFDCEYNLIQVFNILHQMK